ncbi:hypothetical protein [Oryza sativa Japonica Group]|uniref:Uncharacterized protein n=1 Tax=Oryza sativa subsp. japonica TaxID=39947 RepID=Q5JLX0_ORYSJ|nr:hypothetical protein [Oryza sativa Japonica Group]
MSLYAVLTRPVRNLRDLSLGTPRADKALSDPVETKDHLGARIRAYSTKADQKSKSLILRENSSDDKTGG